MPKYYHSTLWDQEWLELYLQSKICRHDVYRNIFTPCVQHPEGGGRKRILFWTKQTWSSSCLLCPGL